MARRTNEWMLECESYVMNHCKCRVLTYDAALVHGLDAEVFIAKEASHETGRLTCTSPEMVYSLKQLGVREKDNYAYIGLLRSKVPKGYWSQFAFIIHLKALKSFIVVLTKDVASNVMQRFAWKMYEPLQFAVLMKIKKHLLFEDVLPVDATYFD